MQSRARAAALTPRGSGARLRNSMGKEAAGAAGALPGLAGAYVLRRDPGFGHGGDDGFNYAVMTVSPRRHGAAPGPADPVFVYSARADLEERGRLPGVGSLPGGPVRPRHQPRVNQKSLSLPVRTLFSHKGWAP
jgi:hypothetical protein